MKECRSEMYCKDCKFRSIPSNLDELPVCESPNLRELSMYEKDGDYQPESNRLLYQYEENGHFFVEDFFGCVHFQAKA